MDALLQKFQHLKIQLEEITSATNNFDNENNCIGVGGFGNVYKGEVTHSEGKSMVAVKRLDPKRGQGVPEFLKEIMMLSDCRHENLISLLGFCYEAGEMILVYDYASRGSLNHHLDSRHLMWSQRLNICLDAAKGISYLHDPKETHQRLIHCDIKSANILLDAQWRAKVSDLGLAIKGPANEQDSVIVTLASGTRGYCDPQYAMTHTLTKESDVYSFGVVLLEVLCGRLCYTSAQPILVPTWIERYKDTKLNESIFKNSTIQPLDQSALKIFSNIAYQCLNESREGRPKMAEVVTALETALERQELSEGKVPCFIHEEMTKAAQPPLNYSSKVELWKLLSKGVLLNGGKTWFSLEKNGEHCELISFAECLDSAPLEFDRWSSAYSSRYVVGTYLYSYEDGSIKTRVKTQFLSPGITYVVNLVFKLVSPDDKRGLYSIGLKYKLKGETQTSNSFLAYEREDGWWACELYQFTSDHRIVDLEILFEGFNQSQTSIQVEGIEFLPLEKMVHKVSEDVKLDIQPDLDANWEEKLPTDYEDIMKRSKNMVQWTMKKEAYSIMCNGFLIDDGKKWFSLDKNGKKCHMLSAKLACVSLDDRNTLPLPESRFGEASKAESWGIGIGCMIESQLVSSQTTYGAYLVYKLLQDQSKLFEAPIQVENRGYGSHNCWYVYLVSPKTPVIRSKTRQNTHNPLNRPKIKGVPQERNDGWMEVQIWGFKTVTTTEMIHMGLVLTRSANRLNSELIIQGVELKPI